MWSAVLVWLLWLTQSQHPAGAQAERSAVSPEHRLTTILPEHQLTTILPEEELTTIFPEEELTTISPEEELTTISPEEELTTISPEDQLTTILPEDQLPTILPEHQLTTILPEDQLTTILPEHQLTTILPEHQLTTISPEDQLTTISPEDQLTTILPEDQLPTISPEEELTTISPEDQLTTILPEDQLPTILPEHQLTTILPEDQLPTILPEHQLTTILPEDQLTTILPEHQLTTILPEDQLTTILPEHQLTTILPEHQLTTILPEEELTTILPEHQLTTILPEDQLTTISPEEELPTFSPEDCSLECVLQGGPGCHSYCRINTRDMERTGGTQRTQGTQGTRGTQGTGSLGAFGSCVPWPCRALLGDRFPGDACQHYVHAPRDVSVLLLPDHNPDHDTAVISWKPSQYGISFLRGFQVTLQALGGAHVSCQLFLFQRNLSLLPSHTQRVFRSDPFPGLALGLQYAVTVMALPVPELWNRFYHSKTFSTRSCPEKNGLERCKNDWYPKHIEVQQEGPDIIVTFNLAPPSLDIRHYFSICYGAGVRWHTPIVPNSTKNKTHYSYNLTGLQEETNYSCEIAADEVDAVRKTFIVHVMRLQTDPTSPATSSPSLTLLLPIGLSLCAILMVLLAGLSGRKGKKTLGRKPAPDIMEHYQEQSATHEEVTALSISRATPPQLLDTPPQLLICYSSRDGPAHVRAVLQLAAFLQQHMATQVSLDLWDSLRLAEEGPVSWHCSRLQQSHFVLVLCSRGLRRGPSPPGPSPPGSSPPGPSPPGPSPPGPSSPDEQQEDDDHSSIAVALVAEELGRAKARGHALSKYMTAVFEHEAEEEEEDAVPPELRLASGYRLPRDLALLFSRLHGLELRRPGSVLSIRNVWEEDGRAEPPAAAAALRRAIRHAAREQRERRAREGEGGGAEGRVELHVEETV